jgi:hypothetical protein
MWRTVPPVHGWGETLPADPDPGSAGPGELAAATHRVAGDALGSLVAPDFVGMSPQDARRTARFAEVRLVVEERPTDSGLRGRVFHQEPEPGAELRPGDSVRVSVGTRPLVAVPDVSGRDEQEALALLLDAGLTPGRRAERRSGSVAVGHVIRTRPRADARVPVGTRVAVVVAVAPRPKRAQARREARRGRGRQLPDDAHLSLPIGE